MHVYLNHFQKLLSFTFVIDSLMCVFRVLWVDGRFPLL